MPLANDYDVFIYKKKTKQKNNNNIRIERTLTLVNGCFYMRVAQHGCHITGILLVICRVVGNISADQENLF